MEHEITGHSRKIYKISKNKQMSFWKKTKEIAIEVAIIVFAVSLAAYLERSREHSHEQAAVKDFLTGLKLDLQSDIHEMTADKKSFDSAGRGFSYLFSLKMNQLPDKDSLREYDHYMSNSTGLIPNNGRFEGFKSSGRIVTIEDKVLQNDIMDLYQESIPTLLASTDSYNKRKEYFLIYVSENRKRVTDSTSNYKEILSTDKAHNLCNNLGFTGEILDRYDSCIIKSKRIIAAIDKAYK
jgi:hypothetical protein